MTESARFFDGSGKLHETLREFSKRLDELHIPYAVTDGMALTVHGYARMTDDIDILIAWPDLKRLHEALVGRGYKVEFAGGKNIRDTTTSVKIEFVRTGDFPGNGKPQPVSFPSPAETEAVEYDGIKFIGLACLVELKLASGMTGGADRAKDLVDVQQLITIQRLPRAFGDRLNEYVRATYASLWDGLHATQKQYVRVWPNKLLRLDATSFDAMVADGVVIEGDGGAAGDQTRLTTTDPDVARKYDMHPESEFFGEDDDE